MKTLGLEIQVIRFIPILAIGVFGGMLLPGKSQAVAATPPLPTVPSDLAIGLAGEFLHDGVQWCFSESPDRPEKLDAKASLVTINSKRDYRKYYSNALMSQGTESTSKDSRYEKFKYTAVYLIWSEEDDCFYWGTTIAKHGMNFVDLSPLMSAGVDPDHESSGYYLYWGETEKADADHFLRSTVSGTGKTLQLSRQGSEKNYSVITDSNLSDVFFDSNGNWQ